MLYPLSYGGNPISPQLISKKDLCKLLNHALRGQGSVVQAGYFPRPTGPCGALGACASVSRKQMQSGAHGQLLDEGNWTGSGRSS
jgi:hypothetical protein